MTVAPPAAPQPTVAAPPVKSGRAALLAKTNKAKTKDKSVAVSEPELNRIAIDLQKAKQAETDARAYRRLIESDAIRLAEPHRVRLSVEQKKCLSSLKIEQLLYMVINRYRQIKDRSEDERDDDAEPGFGDGQTLETQEAHLREIFGADFNAFFLEIWTVELDALKLTDDDLAWIAERDADAARAFKPTKAFHDAWTLNPAVRARAEALGIRPIAYFKKQKESELSDFQKGMIFGQ